MSDSSFQQEYGHHLLEEVLGGRMTRRQLLVRASVVGLSATFAGQLLAACGSSTGGSSASTTTSAAPKLGGTLRVGIVSPTAALEPTTMYDSASIAVVQLVAEYLANVNTDLTLRPVLAESWTPDAAAKVWTFKLRQGVTFQNGKPFGADDVVATFKTLLNPKGYSAALSNFQGILSEAGVEKVDDSTVSFHLDQAFADFPYLVSSPNYDCVILPSDYKAGTWQKHPVGTGPFMLTNYQPKVSATFKKNPNYWHKGLPYLDGVQATFNDDTTSQALALQGGSLDMMFSTPVQGSEALLSDPNVDFLTISSPQYRALHMRVDTAPFTDKRVRQALAYTLDRPALVKALFNNKSLVGNDNVFYPGYPLASKTIPQRTQDIAKAKQLLADAGFPNGVTMNLTVEEFQEIPHFATLIQAMAKQAGITVNTHLVTVTDYYGSGSNQPWLKVPMGITDWAFRVVPEQFFLPAFTSKGIWNSSHFKNPQFDKLAAQYDTSLDEATRSSAAQQMAQLMLDETPAIVAYWLNTNQAVRKNVRGVLIDAAQFDQSATYLT